MWVSDPGTGPIGFVSKFLPAWWYLCVRNSDMDPDRTKIDLGKLLELKSMPKLEILNCHHLRTIGQRKTLKNEFPHLKINQEDLKIADRSLFHEPQNGFWDIEAQKLQEIFPNKPSPKFPLHLLDAI